MVLSPSGSAPPLQQQRLREAFVNGDLRTAFRLLKPQDSCFASPLGRIVSSVLHCRAPSVDYVYVDDAHNRLVLYLTGAKGRQIYMQTLYRWLDIFFSVREKTAGSNDEARAKLMMALVQAGYPLDFSVHNALRKGAAHFCVKSNSVHVLRAMLRLTYTTSYPLVRRPNLQLEDCEGRTPLSYALESQKMECIRLLVAGGALHGVHQSIEHFVDTDDMSEAASDVHLGEGPSAKLLSAVLRRERRVKQLEKRLLTHDSGNEVLAGVPSSMAVGEVQHVLFSDIDTLASSSSLDDSSALTLLARHRFDLQTAMHAATGWTSPPRNAPCRSRSCIVCLDEDLPDDRVSIHMPCGHVTCDDCWKGILRQRLSYGDVHKTVCPEPDCRYYFPLKQLSAILEDQSGHFLHLLNLRYVDNNSSMKWCPRPDCGRVLSVNSCDDGATSTSSSSSGIPCSVRCQCGHVSCWNCMEESHEPATCEQVEAWKSVLNVVLAEKQSLDWVKAETVKCPRCKSPIERDGGCNHMSCAVCHQQFCYQCGQRWKGHADHYTCSLASMLARRQRVRMTSCLWSALDGLAKRFKQSAARNAYEWHLSEYLKHSPNEKQLSSVAAYMMELLTETLPDEDFRRTADGDGQDCQQSAGRMEEVKYIEEWLQVLFMAERVLRNSHILSFNLRSGSSRKKFLANLQAQLGNAVQKLALYFTSFPGFSEILPRMDRSGAPSDRFTQNGADFSKQFFYIQSLHAHRQIVDEVCSSVTNSANQLLRAARLDLLHHAKPHKQVLPSTLNSSSSSSSSRRRIS